VNNLYYITKVVKREVLGFGLPGLRLFGQKVALTGECNKKNGDVSEDLKMEAWNIFSNTPDNNHEKDIKEEFVPTNTLRLVYYGSLEMI